MEDDSDDDEAPGSIDNSDIVAADTSKTDLRSNLEEGKDFVIVSSSWCWSVIFKIYSSVTSISISSWLHSDARLGVAGSGNWHRLGLAAQQLPAHLHCARSINLTTTTTLLHSRLPPVPTHTTQQTHR